MNKFAKGSIVVGAVVLGKLALKTAFLASIFGATYGGVSYAKTEYQMSVESIKADLAETTTKEGGKFIHDGLRFDRAWVDEANHTAVFSYTYVDLDAATLNRAIAAKPQVIEDAKREDFEHSRKYLQREADFRTVFEHDWKVEYRYVTNDGTVAEDYVITRYDVLNQAN
ncbi:hypothetical protein EX011_21565 [Salmonella enterica]|nr:hypothetical protein [Salmonella enterica]EBL7042113.1 hypothetical protein [Salmonella enterica]EHQ9605690.1 hypothetical protein [Salmonella enterica]HAV7961493.1 hypothetical protein [Escherichia coli]